MAGKVQFAARAFSGLASAGTILLTVTRSNGIVGSATVQHTTSDGTALAGADYTTTSGTLTFDVGETTNTFPVPVAVRGLPNRSFSVRLSSPGGNLKLARAVLLGLDQGKYVLANQLGLNTHST